MFKNTNNIPNEERQEIDEICEQIREVLEGTKDVSALRREGSLSPKLERLIALGPKQASFFRLRSDAVGGFIWTQLFCSGWSAG